MLNSQEMKTPRSQSPVEQAPETIYKIEPVLWNNVAPVVYEAVAIIIGAIDNSRGQILANYKKAHAHFEEIVSIRNES